MKEQPTCCWPVWRDKPYHSEMCLTGYDDITPAPPLRDLKDAVIGLVSSGGLVPRGNRDRLVGSKAEQFFRYDIEQGRFPDRGGMGVGARRLRHPHPQHQGPQLRHAPEHRALSGRRRAHQGRSTRNSSRPPATPRRSARPDAWAVRLPPS